MQAEFCAGSRVGARGLVWDLVEALPLGEQTLLRLRCAEGDLVGLEWDVLHPAEQVEVLRAELRPDAPGPLAAWRLYHHACLLEQITSPDELLLAEPGRVRIEPYQLVPLMRALELPRPRLLLADGVGLGKTIEAGLIACELIARRRAHRVLVVSPAGPLLTQWSQELRHRFGLRFTAITDAASLQQQQRKLELGGNAFDAISLCLTTLDFAKQERVLEELERSAWDLAIIDEAHHCIGNLAAEREDTQRRRLAEVVARRSDGLLLLTATPHDGYDPHFASLIELLDPSLVDGRGGLVGTAYRRHVVRRLKSHIHNPATGQPVFRERRVIPVKIALDGATLEPVRQFHYALAALVAPRLRRATQGREHVDALAFVSLLKRSVSTIAACVSTLRVIADRYASGNIVEPEAMRRERARSLRGYRKRLLRFGVLDQADESDLAGLEADGMAADLHEFSASELVRLTQTKATVEALRALIRLGEMAMPLDPKLAAVIGEVNLIRAADPKANVLIYTEYTDSQVAAMGTLRGAVEGEVLSIKGLDDENERTRVAECCAEEDNIVLLSTDSLAEGLNLQRRCCHLIHLDLPYNPNRLEQRNGRIDRYGQEHDPQIRYLYLAGTFEEHLLLRLIAKHEKARAHLSFMPDTLGVTADEGALGLGLVAGFAERQENLFADEAPIVRTVDRAAEEAGLDAYRDLLHEIDRAFHGFEYSAVRHGWLLDGGVNADAAVRSQPGHIDLPDFIAAVIEAETGCQPMDGGTLRLPSDWLAGMDGLPGLDRENNQVRFARDPMKLHDKDGRSLAFFGRAHPLVRRALSHVQRGNSAEHDSRVSVAQAERIAVLLTFAAELRNATRTEFRWIVAVLLDDGQKAVVIKDPARWLKLAELPSSAMDVWPNHFANWVPQHLSKAGQVASAEIERKAHRLAAAHKARIERESAELERWLNVRADEICGAFTPPTGDLFGAPSDQRDWQLLPAPLDRLSAFAADAENPAAQRRAADSVVELFQRRSKEHANRAALSGPFVRPLGMLMLVPVALVA